MSHYANSTCLCLFSHLSQTPVNCTAYVYRTESYHLKRRQWCRKTQLSDITILFLRLEVKKYSCAQETAGENALGCILAPGGWVYVLKRDDHYTFFLRKQTEGHWCKTSPKQFNWRKCVTDFSPLREAHFLPPSLPLLSGRIFFAPKRSMNRCLSGKWRLNFTWRF